MKFLLDTCVLSELYRQNGNRKVRKIIEDTPTENLFISVISIGEILKGIMLLDEGRKKKDLLNWVGILESHYSKRLLSIDLEIVKLWSEIAAVTQKSGKIIDPYDGLIASTAIRHGLYVMTRNIKDFKSTGALLINPWDNID